MKPYSLQELEKCGFLSKIFGSTPAENGWKELNNLLAKAPDALSLTSDDVKGALKKWGVKFNDDNLAQRSGLYRKLADVIFTEVQSKDDSQFEQIKHLAELLELPTYQVKLADKASKTAAYFVRCRNILSGAEKLDIQQLNALFDYDYEDSLAMRKQVFKAHFNQKFDAISKAQRYTPDEEAGFTADCSALNLTLAEELKPNIKSALDKYRNLWNAEHNPLGNIQQDAFPLNAGEICHAYTNCGLCQNKMVEREDNYFELTRKFSIDETVSFKDEKIEHPKFKEEMVILLELGAFFLTNQRIVYIGKKNAFNVMLANITSADFDGVNLITFHTTNSQKENVDVIIKFSDEAAGVMFILFNKAFANAKA